LSDTQYQLKVVDSLTLIPESQWNALLSSQSTPFLQYAFLETLEATNCVGSGTGWQIAHLILEDSKSNQILGAMPLYLKQHSYGEFVFDWSWAEAYAQNGMNYYPKALSAIPFTPVQGARILSGNHPDKALIYENLIGGLKLIVTHNELSSAHILFPLPDEIDALTAQGFMLRDCVQFHWHNQAYANFEDFLAALNMKRRKNIRRERAQLIPYEITYQHIAGKDSVCEDWEFFYSCYQNTYLEHHSSPYLNAEFFQLISQRMPDNLHLIIASKNNARIAASLLFVDKVSSTAYGRYWGALEHIPCLHFETAYYQAIEYCISEGIQTFEGGAQGQHKMARGFLPTTLQSAHWIEDPQFSEGVKRFLEREQRGIANYVDELAEHNPLKSTTVSS
jgi:uncharacterized protein